MCVCVYFSVSRSLSPVDGEQSLAAALSDPNGEDSPRPRTDRLASDADGRCVWHLVGDDSSEEPDKGMKGEEIASDRPPVASAPVAGGMLPSGDGEVSVAASGAESSEGEACAHGGGDAELCEKVGGGELEDGGGGGGDARENCEVSAGSAAVKTDGEAIREEEGGGLAQDHDDEAVGYDGMDGLSSDDMDVEERPVEDVLAELSLSGQKALEGGSDTSSPGAPPAYGDHLLPVPGGSPSIGRSNIIRSLFSDEDGGEIEEGGGEGKAQRERGAEGNEQVGGNVSSRFFLSQHLYLFLVPLDFETTDWGNYFQGVYLLAQKFFPGGCVVLIPGGGGLFIPEGVVFMTRATVEAQ